MGEAPAGGPTRLSTHWNGEGVPPFPLNRLERGRFRLLSRGRPHRPGCPRLLRGQGGEGGWEASEPGPGRWRGHAGQAWWSRATGPREPQYHPDPGPLPPVHPEGVEGRGGRRTPSMRKGSNPLQEPGQQPKQGGEKEKRGEVTEEKPPSFRPDRCPPPRGRRREPGSGGPTAEWEGGAKPVGVRRKWRGTDSGRGGHHGGAPHRP